MKEQYVGDISDYRKYALLRRLAGTGLRIGICWMLTPPDNRSDGRKIGYLSEPAKWADFDPDLFAILRRTVSADGERSLARIESSGAVPNATYFNDIVPDAGEPRTQWFGQALAALASTALIFFDPDNGLDVTSIRKGRPGSSKYVYRDEIAATWDKGHSILIYQHFAREERSAFVARLAADLIAIAPAARVAAFKTAHVVFLLLIQPQHAAKIDISAITDGWGAAFVTGQRVSLE